MNEELAMLGWLARHRAVLPALLLGLGWSTAAFAVPIVTWDLANATGQQAAVLSTSAGVSASVIDEVGVSQWTSTAQNGFVAATGWSASATTFDPGRYYQFSVTAGAGLEVSYETLDVALFRGIWGGGHGAQMWDLHASTDAFVSADVSLGTLDISAAAADTQTSFVGHDISAVGTQTGTVTFRLYGYDQTRPGDYSGLGNDDGTWLIFGTGLDPVVGGTIAAAGGASVPEPAGSLLALSGLLGLFVVGRGRVRAARMPRSDRVRAARMPRLEASAPTSR